MSTIWPGYSLKCRTLLVYFTIVDAYLDLVLYDVLRLLRLLVPQAVAHDRAYCSPMSSSKPHSRLLVLAGHQGLEFGDHVVCVRPGRQSRVGLGGLKIVVPADIF